MANCFFIDFENVHNAGMTNLKSLTKDDLFYIFYTTNAETISLDTVNQLNQSSCSYELIKVPAGSQSLDMHLISFVGYVVGVSGKKYDYIVISKDKDYDNIISFLKEKCGVKIKRIASVNTGASTKTATVQNTKPVNPPAAKPVTANTQPQKEAVKDSAGSQSNSVQISAEKPASGIDKEVEKILLDSGYPQSLIESVNKIISDNIKDEKALSSIHNNLINLTKDFHAIYELIKPTVQEYLKSVVQEQGEEVKKSSSELTLNEKVQKVLREKNYSGEIFNSVASMVCKSSKEKNVKLLVYRNIVAKYGQDKGLEIYRLVKPLL